MKRTGTEGGPWRLAHSSANPERESRAAGDAGATRARQHRADRRDLRPVAPKEGLGRPSLDIIDGRKVIAGTAETVAAGGTGEPGGGAQAIELAERESAYPIFRRVPIASTTIRQAA